MRARLLIGALYLMASSSAPGAGTAAGTASTAAVTSVTAAAAATAAATATANVAGIPAVGDGGVDADAGDLFRGRRPAQVGACCLCHFPAMSCLAFPPHSPALPPLLPPPPPALSMSRTHTCNPRPPTHPPTPPPMLGFSIFYGFETGQYQKINGTYYLAVNELGMCLPSVWDKVTRAGLWSAPNATGPWTRVTTLRNGSHMWSLCGATKTPYPAAKDNFNYVTWTPQLLYVYFDSQPAGNASVRGFAAQP